MAFVNNPDQQTGYTYGEILGRFAKLNDVKNLHGEKICYARSKNLMQFRSFEKINSHGVRIPITTDFETYQKESSVLRGKYLLTDKEGKAVLHDGNPTVDIANPELLKKMAELSETFKAAIQEREDDIKAYNEFMLETVPDDQLPKIHYVKMEDVSSLSQDQMDAVIWFITE